MRSAVFLLLLKILYIVDCSKILMVFPMPSPSHFILATAMAKGLTDAGHDVTIVSPFQKNNQSKNENYREIFLSGFADKIGGTKFNYFDIEKINPFVNIPLLNYIANKATKITLEHPNVQKLLQSNEHFDVVILEQFSSGALKGIAYHYNAPLILFSTIGASSLVNNLIGNPAPPSYIGEALFNYSSEMTFKQRVVNWLFLVLSELTRNLYLFPSQNKILKEHFPDAPDFSILNYNSSLVFLNSHESINQAVPHVPSVIDIGGFHVSPPKDLPKDLKDYMDNATEGVVYFSLGSNIKPSQMTEDKREAILRALGKIKQRVLWKWDEDALPGQPSNVRLSKWFPQQDILAHPNTKLFITHGGLLSTIETIYYGVPVLCFPIFGDQKMNAARAQNDGYGINLAYSDITEEKVADALNTLLNRPYHMDNAKRRSQLMHGRPVKPLDLAVYWTEFVIRHKGAPHLRVAGLDLPWYKYLLLDVIFFVAFIIIASILVLYYAVKKLCCKSKKGTEKLKKN